MKKILSFIITLFFGSILFAGELTKEDFIKTLKDKKVFYHQNKKTKEEMITIKKESVLTNDDLKNFLLFDKITSISIHTPKNIINEGIFHLNDIVTFKIVKLSGSNISDETLKFLEKSDALEALFISSASINGSGLKYIADKKNVDTLNFGASPINDDGIKNISGLENLEDLNLYRTKISDAGMKYLVNLKKMRRLQLDETKITDKSVPYIVEMMGNQDKYDTYVIIYKTKISRNGIKELLKAGIKVNCDYKDLSSEIP